MPTLKAKGKTCIYKIVENDNYDQAIEIFAKALEIDSFRRPAKIVRCTNFDDTRHAVRIAAGNGRI